MITIPELRHIRRIWVNDKHEFDDTLPGIYQDVMGKEFDDPEWIAPEAFKSEEWEILKSVVEEIYPNEELAFEMTYRLIDIENHSNSLNQRKGVADALESCIQRTFYKDEKDATEYYLSQMARKKDLGGKYNEKALDNTYGEPTEDEESDEDEDFGK